jgi:N-acylneuraminate cytidylyltransferase
LDEDTKNHSDVVITVADSHRNPYFNMVTLSKDGVAALVNPPASTINHRQDAPVVYDITTVCYVINSKFVMTQDSIFSGMIRAIKVPPERSIDIDNLLDFQIAECLLNLRAQAK